jgi:hypothetical protein
VLDRQQSAVVGTWGSCSTAIVAQDQNELGGLLAIWALLPHKYGAARPYTRVVAQFESCAERINRVRSEKRRHQMHLLVIRRVDIRCDCASEGINVLLGFVVEEVANTGVGYYGLPNCRRTEATSRHITSVSWWCPFLDPVILQIAVFWPGLALSLRETPCRVHKVKGQPVAGISMD